MSIDLIGWIGTGLLTVAPFFIDSTRGKLAAISGLFLLTVQAIDNNLYNLVILNVAGIIGYSYAIYIRH